ncbi:hypothetical protein V6N13_049667 [Hibiscus sabdariffa]|uniref:Uncharacterized protein n=1 Tax=Hibiscus sabdariffa TaxID=183260 RepID=A0ABR2QWM4_9ROSI
MGKAELLWISCRQKLIKVLYLEFENYLSHCTAMGILELSSTEFSCDICFFWTCIQRIQLWQCYALKISSDGKSPFRVVAVVEASAESSDT